MPRPARKSLLFLVLLAVIVGGAWWWAQPHPPPEPMLNGRPLSEWINPANDSLKFYALRPDQIRAMGPQAVTWLAWLVEHGRQSFSKPGPLPFDKAPDWLRRWVPERWGGYRDSAHFNERTVAAFTLRRFGTMAAPAIPALARSLSSEDTALVVTAAQALQAIGAPSWPAVQDALEHGSKPARIALLSAMNVRLEVNDETPHEAPLDAEVAEVVRAFIKAGHDPDAEVRAEAAIAMSKWSGDRLKTTVFDPAIPELLRLLSDADEQVRGDAAYSLKPYQTKAISAIPRLIELLDDPSLEVRSQAASALGDIDRAEMLSAPRLRAMLRDSSASCRTYAAEALTAFGLSFEKPDVGEENSPAQ